MRAINSSFADPETPAKLGTSNSGKSLKILKIFAKCVRSKPRFLIMELSKIISEVIFPPGMPDSKEKRKKQLGFCFI